MLSLKLNPVYLNSDCFIHISVYGCCFICPPLCLSYQTTESHSDLENCFSPLSPQYFQGQPLTIKIRFTCSKSTGVTRGSAQKSPGVSDRGVPQHFQGKAPSRSSSSSSWSTSSSLNYNPSSRVGFIVTLESGQSQPSTKYQTERVPLLLSSNYSNKIWCGHPDRATVTHHISLQLYSET